MVVFIISLGLCAEELCSTFVAAVRYNLFLFCHSELVDGQTKQKKDFHCYPPALQQKIFFHLLLRSRLERSLCFWILANVACDTQRGEGKIILVFHRMLKE